MDCSKYYIKGKLIPMEDIPYWYIQFLATSPPNKFTEIEAREELVRRGFYEYEFNLKEIREKFIKKYKIRFEFIKEYCCFGLFWNNRKSDIHLWICIVPCFPIHITILKRRRINDKR